MLFEDHFMRMINQAMAALLKIAGLRQAGHHQQAQQAIDQTLEELLGLRADLVRRMEDEALLRALTVNEQLDIPRMVVIADLFREEGENYAAQGLSVESRESLRRALMCYLEVGLASESNQKDTTLDEKITKLVEQLGQENLSEDLLWTQFCYAEQTGEYAQAVQALDELSERPGVFSDLQAEIIQFYERLSVMTPKELNQYGLKPEQVAMKLANAREETDSRRLM
jgi:hypothetical protein